MIDRLTVALADRYTLDRELGQGGMATVYLAQDIKHDRQVAIKVLRPELAAVIGAERFLSEIKTTANLQHPHILPLFDSGEADSFLFYVMPYVEGESLRDRLTRDKHLPIGDAIRITSEVANALDYAHRHGVIHRDIKPENILLHDGRALVADFGIALAASTAGSRMTETGMSLGTPHYMSPEQAMGERELDARTDVYALGVVLYECLTGDPPFTGSTAQAIVSKVVTEKPAPPSKARDTIPETVEDAALAALQKLPADRPASAAEFEAMLTATGPTGFRPSGATTAHSSASKRPWVVAAGLALALAASVWQLMAGGASDHDLMPPSRLAILAPNQGGAAVGLMRQVAISPDGSTVYYTGGDGGGQIGVLRQGIHEEQPSLLDGVERGIAGLSVSQDGNTLFGARATDGTAFRFPLRGGGAPRIVPNISSAVYSQFVAWGPDGSLWGSPRGGRGDYPFRITPGDSVVELVTSQDNIAVTQVLNDKTLLATLTPSGTASGPVVLVSTETGEVTTLGPDLVVDARVTAGFLVYVLATGDMMAISLDLEGSRVVGPTTRIASGVSLTGGGIAQFDVATNGTVVYLPEEPRSLVLVNRTGGEKLATDEKENFHAPRFSNDGSRIALDFTTAEGRDVWVLELGSSLMTRVTFDRDGHDAMWNPDGSLSYITAPNGVVGLLQIRPGSAAQPDSLIRGPTVSWSGEWFADGDSLISVASGLASGSGLDIGIVQNEGAGPITPLVVSEATEQSPALSPDNQWFAYTSDASGREQVYLRRVDGSGEQMQVSVRGGHEPAWSASGSELFYRTTEAQPQMVAAEVIYEPTPRIGDRTALFQVASYVTSTPHANYAVSPDGQQFAMVRRNPSARIMIIQNLPALVARLRGEVQ